MKKFTIILLFIPIVLFSQETTVTGIVQSPDLQETLPGASVQIKGTSTGTTTDVDGRFELAANMGDVLIISFIGMKTIEVPVTGQELKIVMEEDYEELEEVVVVSQGYFDVAKEDLNGSVVGVDADQLKQARTNSIESLIQGQMAGVVVSENSEPGGGIGIAIRGTNSILGGTQPLYVVDGIPINPSEDAEGNSSGGQTQSSLSFLNPNDIEKVEVMKDASATALYGARGANGVVIITTKSGSQEGGSHTFNVVIDHTMSQVSNELAVLTGPQFEEYLNQAALNQLYVRITDPNRAGVVFDGTQEINETNFSELSTFSLPFPETTGINNNWQDATYRVAYSNALNVAYRGGSKDGDASISFGYLNNQGVILNSNFNRVTFNVNASRNASRKLKIYSKTNLGTSWGNASSTSNGEYFNQRSVVSSAILFQPVYDLLEPGQTDELYSSLNDGNDVSNPYTLATQLVDQKKGINMLQSLSTVYKFNPNFTGTLKAAYNYQRNTRDTYYPTTTTRGRRNNGEASQAYFDRAKGYIEGNLRYQKNIKKHHLDGIVIGTYEQTNDRRLFNKAYGFGTDETSYYTFESATDILVPRSVFNEFSLLSGLGRVGYNYKKTYFIDLNARVDASSKFAENQRSAFFPSISVGWIASKEKFMKGLKAISYLKFRASYGQTGSNPIAPYQSLSLLSPIRYNFDNTLFAGYYQSNLSNPNLTWETTDQYNVGMDLNLFESRLRIMVDAYLKNTRDLLQLVKLPASNGFDEIVDNFGEITNKGIDLSIRGDIYVSKKFEWTSSINFSINKNKLVALNSNVEYQLGPVVGFTRTNPIIFMEGAPLGIFWGAETDGIYADWEEANASGIQGAAPGEIKFVNHSVEVDQNGDPLPTQQINFDDYVKIGDPNPDFTFNIGNNFKYGKWDLSVLVTGQKGGDLFWVDSWQLYGMQGGKNVLQAPYENAWRSPLTYTMGDGGVFTYDPSFARMEGALNPAPLADPGTRVLSSDRQVFDASFIRVKNVNFGYTHELKGGQSVRAYFSARNLFTITKYPGYDPESQSFNKDPQRRGVDFGGYPVVRSYVIGLSMNF
ncbi:SusC/RagA family TonB-linked outer membrane protein [Marinoscillum sp. MHG1-6]|uniref:SusC/RagA family TonB-linked outer membrane protein n=1 Tax=Marinoscillum sp. MHG1-6 TaxID=2959627 RepID=UPI0021579D66|nr:SusC/RagA family TonB-linked outer membrane protein [Marinoscillum sp. MHG1-6]